MSLDDAQAERLVADRLLSDEDYEVAVSRGRFLLVVAVKDDVGEADLFEHQAQVSKREYART